jgi:hypothetical protein
VFQIKTYHASFPKDFIVAALKDAPGGVYVALKGVTKDEIKLVAIRYRYSQETMMHFVATGVVVRPAVTSLRVVGLTPTQWTGPCPHV